MRVPLSSLAEDSKKEFNKTTTKRSFSVCSNVNRLPIELRDHWEATLSRISSAFPSASSISLDGDWTSRAKGVMSAMLQGYPPSLSLPPSPASTPVPASAPAPPQCSELGSLKDHNIIQSDLQKRLHDTVKSKASDGMEVISEDKEGIGEETEAVGVDEGALIPAPSVPMDSSNSEVGNILPRPPPVDRPASSKGLSRHRKISKKT